MNTSTSLNQCHCAALLGHASLVEFLLDRGADINTRASWGGTPLHAALSSSGNRNEIVLLLAARGADLEARDYSGSNLLCNLAGSGNIDVVQCFLENGADLQVKEENGHTPLHLAAVNGHREMVALLLEHGFDIDAANREGATPRQLALENGHKDMADLLDTHS